ncbi:hypothetical protein [Algoriphagus boritolerans]|uniref:hypothetical protein n=1 Tax=Algoriphagus boritolerans TaxID=308111 RepID=UPI000AC1B99B
MQSLKKSGYVPFDGKPANVGIRILGETDGLLYGVDVFNSALEGGANTGKSHSLNSLRIYGNAGLKFFQLKNFAVGLLAGIGYGNIRYTLTQNQKPDFPELFERRNFDGYLRNSGMMAKPEIIFEYGIPVTKRNFFSTWSSAPPPVMN